MKALKGRTAFIPQLLCGSTLLLLSTSALADQFRSGEVWRDTSGNPIQAHGGGILSVSNTYYWYGEDRMPMSRGAVACYSSTNLYDWKSEGIALSREALAQVEGGRSFVERPKVLHNLRTGNYVMWMHLEQRGYHFARAGIALADQPTGPFIFLKAIRPITTDFGFADDDPHRQKEFGGTFRDMNVFLDTDGSAFVFYASEGNWTMYVVRLDDTFTSPVTPIVENKTWARILTRQMREAPAPFKHGNRYYLITSACTGFSPNPADYAVADNILGPYRPQGNPCVGEQAKITFNSQSTFVLPVPGKPDAFIFMADRWQRPLSDSRYIWLPFVLTANGTFQLKWRDQWDLGSLETKGNQK